MILRTFVPSVLLTGSLLSAATALADEPNASGGMYAIQLVSASYQAVDDANKPVGAVIPITQKPRGTTGCHLDKTPPSGPVDRWFISFVSDEKKIRMNHSWSEPKDESYCAISVLANLGIPFEKSGEYKFTAKVRFTPFKP